MSYDVFISYSQAGDSLLAERVQDGLARFAKPWWRAKALSVFRDRASLTANPGLWSSIAEAIDDSRFFLLLASPEAATSPWCAREVEQWRSRHGSNGLLVLLTDGEIVWDDTTNDFDWQASTALTPALAGCFTEAPRYVDMRWARSEVQLDLTDGRFRDQITELAAPIHGMTRDELAGTNVRQHRRTLRHAFAAGIALVVMTLAAIAGFAYANIQRSDAIGLQGQLAKEVVKYKKEAEKAHSAAQAEGVALIARTRAVKDANDRAKVAMYLGNEAKKQSLLAFFRQVQAQANAATATKQTKLANLQRVAGVSRSVVAGSQAALASNSTDTSLLLAAQATTFASASGGLISDADVKPALINALQDNPRLIGWLRGLTGPIAAVATSPDSSRAAAVSSDGHVAVWNLRDERLLSTFPTPGAADNSFDLRFLDPNTIVVESHRLDAYRSFDGGTTWIHAWTWKPAGADVVAALAASTSHVVVAVESRASGSSSSVRVEVLNAQGNPRRPILAPGLTNVERIAFAPTGTEFAIGGSSNRDIPESLPGFIVDVFRTSTGVTRASLYFNPDDWHDGSPAITDLRFSADGGQVTALMAPFTVPIHVFDIATSQEVDVSAPGDPGLWAPVVPDFPIGLGPDLDAIVQTDPSDQSVVGIGHLNADSFTGNLHTSVSPSFLHSTATPAFTPDNRSFLMPQGNGVVPVFDLTALPRSHFAQAHTYDVGIHDPEGVGPLLSPDGRIMASIDGPYSSLYDRKSAPLELSDLDGSHPRVQVSMRPSPFKKNYRGVPGLAFDDRGDEIAVANEDGSVDVFDTTDGALLKHLTPAHPRSLHSPSISFSGSLENGRIVETTGGSDLWTWQIRSAVVVDSQTLQFPDTSSSVAYMNSSGSRLVIVTLPVAESHFQAIHVFDASTQGWTEIRSFQATAKSRDSGGALSPQGTELVLPDSTDGIVASYDLDRGALMWNVSGDDKQAWFGPDGSLYTESELTGEISVRSAFDGSVEYTLRSPYPPSGSNPLPDASYSLAFNGSHVLSAFINGYIDKALVIDYPLGTSDLVAAACNEAGRNLTQAEWKRYVGPVDPYQPTCPAFPAGA